MNYVKNQIKIDLLSLKYRPMRNIQAISLILFLIFNTSSCKSTNSSSNKITIQSGQIPPEMESEDFTIIGVLQGRRSYDKYLEKEFAAYSGKYVLAYKHEIDSKYPDKIKYRFIMDYDSESSGYFVSGKYNQTQHYQYYILDRNRDIKYKKKGASSYFALEMKSYLKAIESARKK